ncbi:MAG: sialidase family protein [Vicinamibacteraceae bacterium]
MWSDTRDVVPPDTPRGGMNILFASSDDGGRTWTEPIVVNDDHPSPDAPPPKHFQPTLAVNRDGVVGVAWYDRRDAADNLGWSVRFTSSLDGGQTFLPSVVVAERAVRFGGTERWSPYTVVRGGGTPHAPGGPIRAIVGGISYGHHYSGGDYHSMTTDAAGVFYPYWIGNATGRHQLYTTPITVKGTPHRHLAGPNVVDLSKRVTLEVERTEYDPTNHMASLTVRLRNVSDSPISTPLHVRLLTLHSDIGNPRALDADNALEGPGALYDVSALVAGGRLPANASSKEGVLRFRIDEPRPFKQGDDIKLYVLFFTCEVLGERRPPG